MSPPPVGIGVGDQAGDDGPKGSTCEVTHRGGGRSRGEIVTGILPRFCRKSPKTNPVVAAGALRTPRQPGLICAFVAEQKS
jgi:hypothetical protein